ncbi:hypothetical protein N2152v2_009179 [Parachlorella kessleri]
MRGLQTLISLRSFVYKESLELLHPSHASCLPSFCEAAVCLQLRGVKKQANEVRSGNVLEVNGRLMQVVKHQHTQGAGRQLGNVQFELRDLVTKNKHLHRQRPYDMVELVRLEDRKYQCLYKEGSFVHCMDLETFEQVAVDEDMFGEQAAYLAEGLELTLSFHDGSPVTGKLLLKCASARSQAPLQRAVPETVTLRVEEAAPSMKGETVAPSYKPAVLQNGVKVMVPPFVQRGEEIIVNTVERSFVRRAGGQ